MFSNELCSHELFSHELRRTSHTSYIKAAGTLGRDCALQHTTQMRASQSKGARATLTHAARCQSLGVANAITDRGALDW